MTKPSQINHSSHGAGDVRPADPATGRWSTSPGSRTPNRTRFLRNPPGHQQPLPPESTRLGRRDPIQSP
jgi:hypothetical protein